jgi:ATP-dependent Clp protease ATP-binding subunit ClpA
MWTRFAPRLRKTFFGAMEEARQRGMLEVTAEHLLLSILRDPQCAGFYILNHAGARSDDLRKQIQERLPSPTSRNGRDISLAPSARRAMELAEEESHKLNHGHWSWVENR